MAALEKSFAFLLVPWQVEQSGARDVQNQNTEFRKFSVLDPSYSRETMAKTCGDNDASYFALPRKYMGSQSIKYFRLKNARR
jgi:hypothetical protein